MATRSPERRQHSDRRRRGGSASDLYQRLEEKRKQIERRRTVRRASDRGEQPAAGEPRAPDKADRTQPAEPAVAGERHESGS